ncbi:hypothetical protein O181_102568 [Austropuccinia psidii MF-1]|uniref:Uncharacterized protein n=1 Tax=Austropuccinia psidii MF-1 TaxID=1389203 RepID=A0A9Q3JGK8_9BASI|nr:hypothetical protein [Austropuccinia psidii MF-1]
MTITQNLCSLIDYNKTKPSILKDSMIAMWVLINLPSHLKLIGEIFLQKYNGNKTHPSLRNLWEEFCLYTQRQDHKTNNNASALVPIQGNHTVNPLSTPSHQNPNKNHSSTPINSNVSLQNQLKNFPHCAPRWHNPLTKHKEEDCFHLKPKTPNLL